MTVTWKKQRTRGKTCPSVTSFTINTAWRGLELNPPCFHGDRPVSNHLSRETRKAYIFTLV